MPLSRLGTLQNIARRDDRDAGASDVIDQHVADPHGGGDARRVDVRHHVGDLILRDIRGGLARDSLALTTRDPHRRGDDARGGGDLLTILSDKP